MSTINPAKDTRIANNVSGATNKWMRGRPKLCWCCQKEFPLSQGVESFVLKHKGPLTAGNASHKFVCHGCIEKRKTKTASSNG